MNVQNPTIMKKILVPTDFSPNAQKALNYAIQLAKKMDGEIVLIHTVESKLTKEDALNAQDKLTESANSIQEVSKIKVTEKIFYGIPLYSIEEAIEEFNIELVVMGTLGNAALKGKLFGSKTASVIGKSPVPVLAIPLLGEWKVPNKILIAINRFDEKETLLLPAIILSRLFSASIQVFIFTDTDDDYVEDYTEHEKKIILYCDKLKETYTNVEINAVHLAGKRFKENVKEWIASNNIDIMVMLTHKKNIIEKVFIGSKTEKMSYNIDIPLMAIPVD